MTREQHAEPVTERAVEPDTSGAEPLYPPVGETRVVWAVDARRWDEPAYRDAVESFVWQRITGASIDSARVLQDDAGALMLGAMTPMYGDGGFRVRTPDGLARAWVLVPLPADVALPR